MIGPRKYVPTLHVYLTDLKGKKASFLLTFFGISKKQFMSEDGDHIVYQTLEKRGLEKLYSPTPSLVEEVYYD